MYVKHISANGKTVTLSRLAKKIALPRGQRAKGQKAIMRAKQMAAQKPDGFLSPGKRIAGVRAGVKRREDALSVFYFLIAAL